MTPLLCLLVALAVPRAALSQNRDSSGIVRPRVASAEVFYPPHAQGDAVVILELTIDETGHVTGARSVAGDPPFSTAAVTAAQRFTFTPAQRGGRPVVARIRYQVTFRQPQAAEQEDAPVVGAAVVSEPTTPGEAVPPPPRAIEVTVEGERLAPSVSSFTRAEVRELPGSFGDPFRAVEALPGVTPLISGVPYFFVRGAPPGNVGYFLDGIRVPLLYHVGLGPSVVHPAIVERVDLYSGGYPARYGRFAGGIVAGETTAPRPEFHGEASVRLLDAGAMVEAPLLDGRATVLAGGRYSYTGLLLSLLSPEAVLEYWDYQLRASYDVGSRDTVSVFSFGAFDFLGERQEQGTRVLLSSEFHRIDLRWDHRASARTNLRVATTLGMERTRGEDEDFFLRDRTLGFRSEIVHRAAEELTLSLGADLLTDTYDVRAPTDDTEDDPQARQDFARLFPKRTDLVTGVFAEARIRPARGVTVTPGLRADSYVSDGAGAVGVDPRISARFDVTERFALLHAFGVAHQPPSFVVPVPGFQLSGLRGGLQESLQYSAGFEARLPWDLTATVNVFHNTFFNMTDLLGTLQSGNDNEDRAVDERSLGRSLGLEVFLRRPLTKQLGGFLSYTLSRSTRSIGREQFVSSFDRTHVLNLALGYDLGRRWRVGSRLVFYTGFPVQEDSDPASRRAAPDRVPPFHRIDLRLEKKWPLGKRGYWAFVLEVLNATLQKEVVDVDCSGGRCREDAIGPVTIPSLGVEAAF